MTALLQEPSVALLYDRITEEALEARRRCVRVAWMVLMAPVTDDPRACQWCEIEIGDALRQFIPMMSRKRVRTWLQAAGINPWRKCGDLSRAQKLALAEQLKPFWQEGS